MNLWTVGLSHLTAPVELREKFALDSRALLEACRRLGRVPGVAEGLLVSTCNRVEVMALLEDGHEGRDALLRFLLAEGAGCLPRDEEHFYALHGRDSVRHLFRVAASLDSMVVGEPQILGQLKAAYAVAREAHSLHGMLDLMVTRAFRIAKRVRFETGIGESAVSISFAAVELARRIFGSLKGKHVLILGAGKMSELAARHLHRAGAENIYVTNRTHERAVELASIFRGQSFPHEDLPKRLAEMDIVITSSGASQHIITRDMMRSVMETRRHRPAFLIDIAVPRNVEPSVHQLDQVFLYDIDDLQKVVEENVKGRAAKADEAEEIVRLEVEKMLQRLKGREAAPAIVELQEQLERIRIAEIGRARRKLATLSPEQTEAVDALTRGIVNKIAHGPISELRRLSADPDGADIVEILRRAFRIDSAPPDEPADKSPDGSPSESARELTGETSEPSPTEAVAAERERIR